MPKSQPLRKDKVPPPVSDRKLRRLSTGERMEVQRIKRVKQQQATDQVRKEGWTLHAKGDTGFFHALPTAAEEWTQLDIPKKLTLLECFLECYPEDFVVDILAHLKSNTWVYSSHGRRAIVGKNEIFRYLAIQIRSICHPPPTGVSRARKALNRQASSNGIIRAEWQRHVAHFVQLLGGKPLSGAKLRVINQYFLFDDAVLDLWSEYQQRLVSCLGLNLCGDEKMTTYYGRTPDSTAAKDTIGLWYFQLCCATKYNFPFILDIYMKKGKGDVFDPPTVSATVKRWADIYLEKTGDNTILTFDKYYGSRDSISLLLEQEREIWFLASINPSWWKETDQLLHRLHQQGDVRAMSHIDRGLLIYAQKKEDGDTATTMSNFFQKRPRTTLKKNYSGPFDLYDSLFFLCDEANSQYKRFLVPGVVGRRSGNGKGAFSRNSILSFALVNTTTAYFESNELSELERENFDYGAALSELADDLWAMTV